MQHVKPKFARSSMRPAVVSTEGLGMMKDSMKINCLIHALLTLQPSWPGNVCSSLCFQLWSRNGLLEVIQRVRPRQRRTGVLRSGASILCQCSMASARNSWGWEAVTGFHICSKRCRRSHSCCIGTGYFRKRVQHRYGNFDQFARYRGVSESPAPNEHYPKARTGQTRRCAQVQSRHPTSAT